MAATSKNQIDVILNFISKGFQSQSKQISEFNKRTDMMTKRMNKQQSGIIGLNSRLKEETSVLRNLQSQNGKLNETQKQAISTQKGMVDVTRNELGALRGKLALNKDSVRRTKLGTELTRKQQIQQKGMAGVFRMSTEEWSKFNKQGGQFNSMGGRMANRFRKMTHGLRGFKMEMLGVMFFGMSLQRGFMGLLRTSLEWVGVFDLLKVAMGVLFLPIALEMLDWVIKFTNWVSSLTEEQKLFYGRIVLLGVALGTVLMVLGTFALGIGSLVIAFGWLFSKTGLFIAALTALGGFGYINGWFDKMTSSADKLKEPLTALGVSGELFTKSKDKIIEWYNALKTTLFGNKENSVGWLDKVKEKILEFSNSEEITLAGKNAMAKFITGVKQFFLDNPLALIGAIIGGFAAGPIGAGIGAALGTGLQALDLEQMDSVLEKGKEILTGFINGVINNIDSVSLFLEKMLEAIGTWIGENSLKLLEIGAKIAAGIVKGMIKGVLGGLNSLLMKIPGIENIANSVNKLGPNYQGSEAIGGKIPSTGLYTLHRGEEVIPTSKVGNNGQNINVTYNVTVADKREFESMLKANNDQMTREIRRLTK